jgi:hypothetical protein
MPERVTSRKNFALLRRRNKETVLVEKECPYKTSGKWCGSWCPLCFLDEENKEVVLTCGGTDTVYSTGWEKESK